MKAIKLTENFKLKLPKNAQVLGAKMVTQNGTDKIIIAIKDGASTLIKSITDTGGNVFDDIIEEIIDAGTPFFVKIEAIFDDLFNRLPRYIEQDGIRYELALFPAPRKDLDRVTYQAVNIAETKNNFLLLQEEAPAMIRAKFLMHRKLEELGYL